MEPLCTAALLLLHVREQRARMQVWLDCKLDPVNRVHHHHHRRCCYHEQCFFQQLNLCHADLLRLEIYTPLVDWLNQLCIPVQSRRGPAVLPPTAQQLKVPVILATFPRQALLQVPAPCRLFQRGRQGGSSGSEQHMAAW